MPSALHTLWVKIGVQTAGLSKDIKGVTAKFGAMGQQLQMAGIRAGFMFTAPITIAAKKAFKEIAEFDRNMARSTAIMGDLSDTMMDKLAGTAKQVAREVPRSAKEMAEGFFFLASAGLDASQAIAALPAVTQFAIAGAFDLARATSLAADAQSALGLKSQNAISNLQNLTRVTDVLVKANTLANATTEQFSRSLTTKAGAAIKIVNKEMEEGVAVLAAFADQGIKSENAGTALNIVFRDLKTKGLKNRVEWEKLGGVYDKNTGKMRHMADIIESLEGHLKGFSNKTAQAKLKLLGFSDKSLVFTQALIGMSDKIREYESELQLAGGTTKEVADKQIKNIGDQMKIAQQKIEGATRELGDSLKPAFESLIVVMGFFEDMILAVAAAIRDPFWGPIIVGFATFLASVGPLLIALSMLSFAIAGVSAAFTWLFASMGPIGWVILGLVVVIGGLTAAFSGLDETMEDAGKRQQKVNDLMSETKKAAQDAIRELDDFNIAARIGTVVKASYEDLNMKLGQLMPRYEHLRGRVDAFNKSIAELTDRQKDASKSVEDDLLPTLGRAISPFLRLQMQIDKQTEALKKISPEYRALLLAVTATEAQLEAMRGKWDAVNEALDGSTRSLREQAAVSAVSILINLELERSATDLEAAMMDQTEAFKGSGRELKFLQGKLKMLNAMMALAKRAGAGAWILDLGEKIKLTKEQVGELRKSLGLIGNMTLVDLESLDMAQKMNVELKAIEEEARILNSLNIWSEKNISDTDIAKTKLEEAKSALSDLVTKAAEMAGEGIPLADVLMLPEFSAQLTEINGKIVTLQAQIADGEGFDEWTKHMAKWAKSTEITMEKVGKIWTDAFDTFSTGFGNAVGKALVDGESFKDSMKVVFNDMVRQFISAIATMIMRWAIGQLIMQQVSGQAAGAKIGDNIATGATAAYAAYVGIPIVGPGLAMAAAMAAIAGGALVATLGKAAGGVLGLASGGIVTSPTFAMIGEAGPEAVIPLTGRNSLSSRTQQINLYMDGELVTETVLRNMPDEVRLNLGPAI